MVKWARICGQWKQEGILYKQVNKIYHFTLTVSPHYLVKLKLRISSTFWSKSSRCFRSNRLFATLTESRPIFVFSNFLVGSSFVSLLAKKNIHIHSFFVTILSLSSNSTYSSGRRYHASRFWVSLSEADVRDARATEHLPVASHSTALIIVAAIHVTSSYWYRAKLDIRYVTDRCLVHVTWHIGYSPRGLNS